MFLEILVTGWRIFNTEKQLLATVGIWPVGHRLPISALKAGQEQRSANDVLSFYPTGDLNGRKPICQEPPTSSGNINNLGNFQTVTERRNPNDA